MILKSATIFLLLLGFGSSVKIVCYYTLWGIYGEGPAHVEPEDLDPSLCTHINYGFAGLNDDGNVRIVDPNADIDLNLYLRTTSLKEQNQDLKVLLSIGATEKEVFSKVAADPQKRSNFVQTARYFMQQYRFDGIDIVWEIPVAKDKQNFVSLLQELKDDFDKDGWELSVTVKAIPYEGYDVPKINELASHINLMSYNMHTYMAFLFVIHNAPLYESAMQTTWEKRNINVDASVKNWVAAGASPEKLILGLAFYGNTFKLRDTENWGIHAPVDEPGAPGPFFGQAGVFAYVEYCSSKDEWECHWDDDEKVPLCTRGDQWLGIDTEESMNIKVDYIKINNLGGAMLWSLNQDDVKGNCGRDKPLLRVVHNSLMRK